MMSFNHGYHHLDNLDRFEERLARIEGKLTGLCKWLNKNHDIGIPDEFLIETEDGNYNGHYEHDNDIEEYVEDEDEDDEEPEQGSNSNDIILDEEDIKPSFDIEESDEPSILSDLNFENNNEDEDQYQEEVQSSHSQSHLINEQIYQSNNAISITPIISTTSSHPHNTPTSTTNSNANARMPNLIPFNFKQQQIQQQLQRLTNHPRKILLIPPQSQLRNMNMSTEVSNYLKIKQGQQILNSKKNMRYFLEANNPATKLPPKLIENNSVSDKTCYICKKEFFGNQLRQRIQRHLERIHKIEIDRSHYKIRIRRNKLVGFSEELRDVAVSLFNELLPGKIIQASFFCPICPKLSPKKFEGSQLRARFARHLFRIHQVETGFKVS